MAVIYILVTVLGAQSRGVMETAANGGEALARIAEYYFGSAGAFVLAAIVTVACLKTAVGLITSCGETFSSLVPDRAFLFCLGGGLLCTVFFDRESGPGYDPCLFGSCFDVPLSACDRFGTFDAFWKSLWK